MKRLIKYPWLLFLGAFLTIICLNMPSCVNPESSEKKEIENSFVGSETCISCHQEATDEWKGSHHDWAMKLPDEVSVFGDFNDALVELDNVDYHFSKHNDAYKIRTVEEGDTNEYEVAYTFGVYPLQQYLIEFPDGKFQTLRASWDREKNKWFHQYENDIISPDDWLHWTQGGQRWNTMCAECHSTNLKKNYQRNVDAFETSYDEINVGCESCHGMGAKHLEWADSDKPSGSNEIINTGKNQIDQINVCGACHSRRVKLTANMDPTSSFTDQFLVQNITNDYYHDDGQILEEDYVMGSFMQSKMYHNKVKCSDCHNTHTLELKLQGNSLCMQCHDEKYDSKEHNFHAQNTEQSQCINCHMTGKYYMGNDFRRDHSFRIPRPDQSVKYETPNACIGCHDDKSDQWAADWIIKWYGPERPINYTDKLLMVINEELNESQKSQLLSFISNAKEPDIARSTMIQYLPITFTQEEVSALIICLKDSSPFVRYNAISKFEALSIQDRQSIALKHISDESKLVRIGAARLIIEMNIDEFEMGSKPAIRKARKELQEMLFANADFPLGRLQLGDYYLRQNQISMAIEEYNMAIEMDDRLSPVYSNLATAYNLIGDNEKALETLNKLIEIEGENARAYYLRGLLNYEIGIKNNALRDLESAVRLEPENGRYLKNLEIIRSEL